MKILKEILLLIVFLILLFFASWAIINIFVPLCQSNGFWETLRIFGQSWVNGIKALF